jgi:hypothetical protein
MQKWEKYWLSFTTRILNRQKPIYTITSIGPLNGPPDSRCVGFFYNLKRAQKIVKWNEGDLYEMGSYPYCVIEETKPGIYSYIKGFRKEWWYRYNTDADEYVPCEKPPEKSNVIGFGIG